MNQNSKRPNAFRPGLIALAVALGYIVLCGLYVQWSTSLAERWAGSVHQLAVLWKSRRVSPLWR